jgi:EmrB/QacA subfamily drug resistance transporter
MIRPAADQWTGRQVTVLLVLCVGHVLETVDITITNVALPAIRAGVGFGDADLSWVVNGYAIAFAGFLLLGARAGAVFGERRVLTAALVVFCAASVLAATAQSPWALVAGRGVQGLAAAFIAPMTLALLATVFPAGRNRDTAVAVWAMITTVSGSLAMLAGGLLTEGPGWRAVFWVNVPVAALVLLVGLRVLPADRPRDRSARIDPISAALASVGVSLLVAAVIGVPSGRSMALLAAATGVLAYAAVHEMRRSADPLLPRGLFVVPGVTRANVAQALCGGAIVVMFYMVTLYQQNVLGFSPWQTALAYLPHTVVLLLAAQVAPWLTARIGAARTAGAGAVLGTAGLALLATVPARGTFAGDLLVPSLLLGAAIPLCLVPNTTAALAGVPRELHAAAAGLVNVARVLGGTMALAVASAAAAARTQAVSAVNVSTVEALTSGYRIAFAIGTGLFAAAALVALARRVGPRSPEPAAEVVPPPSPEVSPLVTGAPRLRVQDS